MFHLWYGIGFETHLGVSHMATIQIMQWFKHSNEQSVNTEDTPNCILEKDSRVTGIPFLQLYCIVLGLNFSPFKRFSSSKDVYLFS